MKIKEISIKNFRGIEDLTIKLDKFTVLIGKNGVDKSSILHYMLYLLSVLGTFFCSNFLVFNY